MKKRIKEYWSKLKAEYENKYKENIFKNYEQTVPVFEEFRKFLNELLSRYPTNVDIVCTLASVELELRYQETSIKLLEDFILKYKDVINDVDKVRIYTNLGFYYEADKKQDEYLLEAEKLNSPFVETYKGLTLTYFSNYENDKATEDLYKSLKYFEKALKITNDYEIYFGYAVCLFETKQYQKAKEIFEELLLEYPNRMRLLLSISYCEAYLGNKEKAIHYLKQVKVDQDENYYLGTDDIGEFEVFEVYYFLEEYDLFLEECEKEIMRYYFADWDHYFYILWIKNENEKFNKYIEKYKNEMLEAIEEAKIDDDFSDEEERQDYIKSYEEDLEKLMTMSNKIQNGNYKPKIELKLYPEYGCFLIDCIRHNF
ncbi:tetratricopeptide repeat protein [Fusobacterium hwasookii]|uniref:tetratricopeptide repeat protein n=1 Tax=Fusobacterium hwasookii TaxID=1583098 RepID=UPI0028EE1996|nr:tetratricopeptide repeat protein [Fusobacterium hwasookii]